MKIHFVGIGGAGASATATIAQAKGYEVSGCDTNIHSRYLTRSTLPECNLHSSHDPAHVADVDIVAASPAALQASPLSAELQAARAQDKLMSWQAFLGSKLMAGHLRACVAGTHGKTTTTAMLGHILINAGLDPTVLIGGIVPDWQGNAVVGKSDIFLCEADEFNNNFLHYRPNLSVLTNVEYEHPEFFADADSYFDSFRNYIEALQPHASIIANLDDHGVRAVIAAMQPRIKANNLRVVWVTRNPASTADTDEVVYWHSQTMRTGKTRVSMTGFATLSDIEINMIGRHNAQNAVMAFCAAKLLGANLETAQGSLSDFRGVERRLQEVFSNGSTRVFDDYGHHPTEVMVTLNSLREAFPEARLIAVIEPHMVSRMNEFGDKYVEATQAANRVVFTKTFLGRETGKSLPNILAIVRKIGAAKSCYFDSFEETAKEIGKLDLSDTIIVVFGAGNSPELTKSICRLV